MSGLRELSSRLERLQARAEERHGEWLRARAELTSAREFLELAPRASERLDELSSELFGRVLEEITSNLTLAVRDILGQDRTVRAVRDVQRGKLHITFTIEQDGQEEDILTGQGGSVCNILSVGLRLVALSQLDPARHRPFLVLDEQDCWLKPDLVPRLTGVVKAVAHKLGVQVLLISHHHLDRFSFKVDRIYGLEPGRDGARLRILQGEGEESPSAQGGTDGEFAADRGVD